MEDEGVVLKNKKKRNHELSRICSTNLFLLQPLLFEKKKTPQLVWNLRRHAASLEKTLRARVLRWCAKFEAEKESPALVWKKGRNQHARGLLAALRSGRLVAPFDAGPPEGPLGAALPLACAAAVGLREEGRRVRPAATQPQQQQQRQWRPPLVPGTESLRLAPPLAGATAAREDSSSSSFARAQLPSRVELAASLGAAAERIAELEWRLGEGERRAKARAWEAGVAAARASAALLDSSSEEQRPLRAPAAAAAAAPLAASPQVVEEAKRLPPSPLPPLPKRGAAAAEVAAGAAGTPRPQLRRTKKATAPPPPTSGPTPQRTKQKALMIPSVSLEELSRRISALAPQQ